MEALAVVPAAVELVLVVVQLTRFRGVPQSDHRPALAWIRAGTYIAFCWFVSIASGTFDRIVSVVPVDAAQLDDPAWWVWSATYVAISVWQGAFQDLYWDVYVSPEHDTPWSITRKVAFSHIPNVTVTLTYLVLFGNRLIFVGLQTLALIAASLFMRMPSPGETRPTLAPTTGPAFGQLVRAIGYQTDDPDPCLTERRRSTVSS